MFRLQFFNMYLTNYIHYHSESKLWNKIFGLYFLLLNYGMCCLCDIQFFCEKGVLTIFLTILAWMCACNNGHMMVNHTLFDVTIRHWHGYLTHSLFYMCYFCLFLLLMPIWIVFLARLHPPLGFFLPPPLGFLLPPPLGFLLFVQPMFHGLHRIFKLTTHTRCHIDHFHSFATFCVWLLLMNIGPFYSSPTTIMLGIINGAFSFDLSIWLTTNYPLELVSSCSWNPGQTSILR